MSESENIDKFPEGIISNEVVADLRCGNERCKNTAVVWLTIHQDGMVKRIKSCLTCWKAARENGIEIVIVEPLSK